MNARHGSGPQGNGLFQVAQSVTSAFDVDDVTVMQQPIQDRSRQHFVSRQQFRPVLDALIGGDQDGAPAVAVADLSPPMLYDRQVTV